MNPHAEFTPLGPPPPRQIPDEPQPLEPEIDARWPPEIDDQAWDVFLPDDDYESLPGYGDFWTDQDAA